MPAEKPNPPHTIAPSAFEPLQQQVVIEKKSFSWLWLALFAALFAALVSLWFIFTARSVLVQVQPDDASVSVSGGLSLALGSRKLLRPGEYQVRMTHAEFETLEEKINVDSDAEQEFRFQLRKKPDQLALQSEPPGAAVFVDGAEVGETPQAAIDLYEGEHKVEINHPRYLPVVLSLNVTGGGKELNESVALKPAWAQVELSSEPAGAKIYVDSQDEPVGETPMAVELIQGQRTVSLRLDGYKRWQQTVDIEAQQDQTLALAVLEEADAMVQLRSQPSQASVVLDGQYQGQTPLTLNLEADKDYALEVFKAGFKRLRQQLSYASGAEETLDLALAGDYGKVSISAGTPGSVIAVNGKRQTGNEIELSLPATPQKITVSKAGYQSFEKWITPKPGYPQRVAVALKTAIEAKVAKSASAITTAAGQKMVLLNPGDFTMGASRREPGRRANEALRNVEMDKPFYLSENEVTNAEFKKFKPGHSSGSADGESLNNAQQPVVNISWLEAAEYCNWLSAKDNLKPVYEILAGKLATVDLAASGYRLPSEAEWSWAARRVGAVALKFPWGKSMPPAVGSGNYGDESASVVIGSSIPGYKDGFIGTAPVGTFPANKNGIKDMGGNVAEWVHDFYLASKPEKESANPFGPESGEYHVVRGAGWRHSSVTELRLSFRDYSDSKRDDLGFRVARYID